MNWRAKKSLIFETTTNCEQCAVCSITATGAYNLSGVCYIVAAGNLYIVAGAYYM